jgi:MFS family permease
MQSKKTLRRIYLLSFLVNIQMALSLYVNSSFIGVEVGEQHVGLIFSAGSLLSLLTLVQAPRLISWCRSSRLTLLLTLIILSVTLGILGFSHNGALLILAFIVYQAFFALAMLLLDLFVEEYSENASTGDTRGLYLTIVNIAILVSPLIAGQLILINQDYRLIYIVGGVLTLLGTLLFVFFQKRIQDIQSKRAPLITTIRKFLHHRQGNTSRAFWANFLLQFFFAWMVIYVPLYLNQELGFSWEVLGVIFTIMLSPFVLFEIPLGKLADRRYGEKEIMSIGFLIMAVAVFMLAGFSNSTAVWIFAAILFLSRIGASAVQVTTESYFFKQVDETNSDFISIFRYTGPLAFLLAPLSVSLIYWLLPNTNYTTIFSILGIITLGGLWFSLRLRDTR